MLTLIYIIHPHSYTHALLARTHTHTHLHTHSPTYGVLAERIVELAQPTV